MTGDRWRLLDGRAKSASVRRLFACGCRSAAQENAAGETFYDTHRPAARGPARTDAPRDPSRRPDHAAVHRGERLSGAEGRADLRDLDPRRGDLDGAAALAVGRDDPRESYRPDHRQCPGTPRRDHLLAARTQ